MRRIYTCLLWMDNALNEGWRRIDLAFQTWDPEKEHYDGHTWRAWFVSTVCLCVGVSYTVYLLLTMPG